MENSRINKDMNGLMSQLEGFINTKTVVGEPIHIDNTILVPLVDVSFGAATASKVGNKYTERHKEKERRVDGESDAGAGGLGAKVSPSAMLVIQNGTTQLINVRSQDSITKLIDMIPGVVAKAPDYLNRIIGKKGEENQEEQVDLSKDDTAEYHQMNEEK